VSTPTKIKYQGHIYKRAANLKCRKCGSDRVCEVHARCESAFRCWIQDHTYMGYVPDDLGLGFTHGGGDHVTFSYCLNCGQMQGRFPLKLTKIEQGVKQP